MVYTPPCGIIRAGVRGDTTEFFPDSRVIGRPKGGYKDLWEAVRESSYVFFLKRRSNRRP